MARIHAQSLAALATLVLLSGDAFAQEVPDAGSLLRQEEESRQPEPDALQRFEAERPLPELTGIGDATVVVRQVEFTGATELVGEAGLQAVVSEALGRRLDFNGLQALAERVTRHLKAEGWILARAYLPEQDVTNGIITIGIIPGRLDTEGRAFRIEAVGERALRIDPLRLGRMLTELVPEGEPVRADDINRAVLLINDLPGIGAAARFEPGESPGSSHVLLSVEEGPLWAGDGSLTNTGNRSTGRTRSTVQARLNDPGGRGEQFQFGATRTKGLDYLNFGYSQPLGHNGLVGSLEYARLHYDIVSGEGSDSDISGKAAAYRASVEYPLLRSRRTNLWLGFDLERENLKDTVESETISDRHVDVASLPLTFVRSDAWRGGGRNTVRLTPVYGDLDLSGFPRQAADDAASFERAGHFGRVAYELNRLQALGDTRLSLFAQWRGQWASKNLDSSQRFQPAGPRGVRAYPGGEASSDEGNLLRAELRYALPVNALRYGSGLFGVFYDVAWVRRNKDLRGEDIDSATGRNRYRIEGAGVRFVYQLPERLSLSVTWAHAIGDNPGRSVDGTNSDGLADDHQVWLEATLQL
ncbi:ShlB/FhaC/HecB family hemolysin secretion/activation protein [Spiribacter sp. 221]|uniref:ShlB/FhaC/HecB family hemolysin secretion/activation protein n=1 Tax=Spiribacter onubensis TaxID=3122420 RepID=UPI00349F792D